MAQSSPESLVRLASSLDNLGFTINKYTQMLCACLAAMMVLTVGFGVVERYVLHWGHTWPEELARYIMIWMALLAVPVCAYRREHIGLDLIFSRLPLGVRPGLRVVLDLLGIAFFAILFFYSIAMCEAGTTQYATIFGITMLIPFLSVPVTCTLSIVQISITMVREYAGITPKYILEGQGDTICSQ